MHVSGPSMNTLVALRMSVDGTAREAEIEYHQCRIRYEHPEHPSGCRLQIGAKYISM